ncbi:SixA phosphatase family protein [Luteipulveratus halotolerans]|uniref:Phosphohistidine phosphatase n=1 Tax=Luteipulveratus halotolerans TaxID=1631356 RepID=A0A0L6CGN3_9MICO|nr:histidine phosphatase family protein [Luteipulveratus halotolerans]KNX36673.1 hypothetical protein VV01_05130 [Luteipulveratus halotolerans]
MNDATHRQLVLLRHAKAEDPEGKVDHERSLTERGHADAAAAGQWLREQGIAPDLVLCSTSARTRETWAAVVEASRLGTVVEHEPRIYNAPPERLLDVVREADADAITLVVVGHAPGIPGLAVELADGEADDAVEQRLAEGYPTATIAVLDVDTDWADLAPGAARLRAVHTARG